MNDDAAASSSSSAIDRNGPGSSRESAADLASETAAAKSAAERRKQGLKKKFEFITHLMTNLDALVYAELCTLYYMDCCLFSLLIRLMAQSFFLSPKSVEFLLLMPTHRPHVVAIFFPNFMCMTLHLISSLPQASEASRGYLHGGVIIDFIGQKAPTSKLLLLLLDLVILALQCVMLTVHGERERLRMLVFPGPSRILGTHAGSTQDEGLVTTTAATAAPVVATTADYDAAERGVSRDAPDLMDDASGSIELRPLWLPPRSDASAAAAVAATARDPNNRRRHGGNLAEGSTHSRRPPDLVDYMMSGNAVLGDFQVLDSIRVSRENYQTAAAQSLQSLGYAATLARLAAEPRARFNRLGTTQGGGQ